MEANWITKEWESVCSLLPAGWREQARTQHALRRGRQIKTADELLRLLLLHAGPGLSLRQTVIRAGAWGLPKISDVSLLKRLKGAEAWLRWMCQQMLRDPLEADCWRALPAGYRVVAVDTSTVEEPGATGTDWRLHYALELPSLLCRQVKVTDSSVGESLRVFRVEPKDLLMGDRGFCRAAQIAHVIEHQGEVLVRWHSTALPLVTPRGKPADVVGWLESLGPRQQAELPLRLCDREEPLRVVAVRVSSSVASKERERVKESARKNGRKPSAQSLLLANFIVVVTSLPATQLDTEGVLRLYRLRWQIELAFKRLKSLLATGHVPKTDPLSARAWLQAKLLTSLLIEKLLLESEVFSPWGSVLPEHKPVG
jgi:hypothetical protein